MNIRYSQVARELDLFAFASAFSKLNPPEVVVVSSKLKTLQLISNLPLLFVKLKALRQSFLDQSAGFDKVDLS